MLVGGTLAHTWYLRYSKCSPLYLRKGHESPLKQGVQPPYELALPQKYAAQLQPSGLFAQCDDQFFCIRFPTDELILHAQTPSS